MAPIRALEQNGRVRTSISETASTFRELTGRNPQFAARAPGRIEFLGNHTDYNLGQVLGVAIDRGTRVLLSRRADRRLCFHSDGEGMESWEGEYSGGALKPVTGREGTSWVNYPLGVLEILRQQGLSPETGFDLLVSSDLPVGAGLSSSAALEIATALALGSGYAFTFADGLQLMRTGWRAETEFVGMPCGILDQTVVVFGQEEGCVWIDCKTEQADTVPLPERFRFWLFNTAEKHSLIDSLYAERHRECGEARGKLQEIYPEIEGLCDLSPGQLEAAAHLLPDTLLKRARHVVQENARVEQVVRLLKTASPDSGEIGDLLNLSHASSRELFENSTDPLDHLVNALQGNPRVCGARLTGGGFGGAVLALTGQDFSEADAEPIRESYRHRFGGELELIGVQAARGAHLIPLD